MAALVHVFDDRDGALVALGRSAELLGARGETILGAWAATVASLGHEQAKQAVSRSPQLLRAATIRDAMTALVEVCVCVWGGYFISFLRNAHKCIFFL